MGEKVCGSIVGPILFGALLLASALWNYLELKSIMLSKLGAYAAICLWYGPTPNTTMGFDGVVFPVPGFCESLTCDAIANGRCLWFNRTEGENWEEDEGHWQDVDRAYWDSSHDDAASKYIAALQEQCFNMLQQGSQVSQWSKRVTD